MRIGDLIQNAIPLAPKTTPVNKPWTSADIDKAVYELQSMRNEDGVPHDIRQAIDRAEKVLQAAKGDASKTQEVKDVGMEVVQRYDAWVRAGRPKESWWAVPSHIALVAGGGVAGIGLTALLVHLIRRKR